MILFKMKGDGYMKSEALEKCDSKKVILIISSLIEKYIFSILEIFNIKKMYKYVNCNEINHIVQNLEAEKIDNDEYMFIVCSNKRDDNENLIPGLVYKYKRNNIIFLKPNDVWSIYREFYKRYLSEKNIDIGNDFIQINNYKIGNFLDCEKKLISLGDSILPSFFEDLSMCEEGPFEYGEVIINPENIVIDCGGYCGAFSTIALAKEAKVYIFEPLEENIKLLEKNLSYYSNEKYTIENKALGQKNEIVEFFVPFNRTSGTTKVLGKEKDRKLMLPVISIDSYVEENLIERVDFIKADIEGAEREMLNGASNTIRKFSPKLSICTYHLPDDSKVLEDIILKINSNYIIEHKWMKLYAYVPMDKK